MDLLFLRYASPFLLIDQLISMGTFFDFIDKMFEEYNEQKLWDYYLHKVDASISYNDWKSEQGISCNTSSEKLTKNEIETTLKESLKIANSFRKGVM